MCICNNRRRNQQHHSIINVCRYSGISGIFGALCINSITMGHRWNNYNPFDKQSVLSDYKNLVCLTELAKKYNIGYERIRRFLLNEGVLIGDKSSFYKEVNSRKFSFEDELIKDYNNDDFTIHDVIRKYKIGVEKLKIILKRNESIVKIRTNSSSLII